MLDDLDIGVRQNVGLTAILLFCSLYLLYNLAHPRGFSSAVLVQNGDEILALTMLASSPWLRARCRMLNLRRS
jgi:ribose transport system permease protein